MRTSSIGVALLLLAACSEGPANTAAIEAIEEARTARAEDDGAIECAPAGAAAFARTCTLDREQGEGGLILTARNPDGGFRRLLVTEDGRGVVAADGAERAVVTIIDADRIEVALGGDRYRLPATVKPQGTAR